MNVTPVAPLIHASCDATESPYGLLHVTFVCDSDNQLFLYYPSRGNQGVYTYQWFALSKNVAGYPVGDITDINCSCVYTSQGLRLTLVALANNVTSVYTAPISPIQGILTTYQWKVQSPSGISCPPLPLNL